MRTSKGFILLIALLTIPTLVNAGNFLDFSGDSGTSSGSGTPGGSDTQFQYNNGGAFGGCTGFTYNDLTHAVSTNTIVVGGEWTLPGALPPIAATSDLRTVLYTDGTSVSWDTVVGGGGSGGAIPTLDQVLDPVADKTFVMGNNQVIFQFGGNDVDNNFEIDLTGNNSGDGLHIHQHTGNPTGGRIAVFEWEDTDVGPFTITSPVDFGLVSNKGIYSDTTLGCGGTVSGITVTGDTIRTGSYIFPVADGTNGYTLKTDGSGVITWQADNTASAAISGSVVAIFDGGGSAIETDSTVWVKIPYACTITEWDVAGYATCPTFIVDVRKSTYTTFDPNTSTSISGTELPTLTSQQKNQDELLSTWTTAVAANSYLYFTVTNTDTITKSTVTVSYTRTL